MRSQVYWTEEYPLGKNLVVSDNLPKKVDFIIIGSGYTGLTAARVLAKADNSVAVLDEKILDGELVLATVGWQLQVLNKIFLKYIKNMVWNTQRSFGKPLWTQLIYWRISF